MKTTATVAARVRQLAELEAKEALLREEGGPVSVKPPPTYQELAELVACLTEANIANTDQPEARFVKCFTYGADRLPDHWWHALQTREALIASQIIDRRHRIAESPVFRDRRGKKIVP